MKSLKTLTPKQLLQLTGQVIDELQARRIVRTSNNPLADYTEWLVASCFKLTLADSSAKGYDATDRKCETRYQIKGRRITTRNQSRQLSAIRNIDDNQFDFLVSVIFDQDFNIIRAMQIPHQIVKDAGSHSKHTNSLILHARDSLLELDGVKDVTERVVKQASLGTSR